MARAVVILRGGLGRDGLSGWVRDVVVGYMSYLLAPHKAAVRLSYLGLIVW